MDIAQSGITLLSALLMFVALGLAFIPIMPGTLLVWAVGLITAVVGGFTRVTPTAAGLMTLVFLFGVSSDFWLPLLGVKGRGLSCLSAVGSLIGGLAGTFLIPLPILGTLIGCVAGAVLVEWLARQNMSDAVRAGRTAASLFVIGYLVEIGTSIAIAVIFFISLLTTA